MIISDRHRFVFVHIPKCAGVSVKQALRPIDDSQGGFSRIGDHDVMGRIHFAHIVLSDLEAHLPATYAKVADYESVAIIRDPVNRFVSAMFQRLREFKGADQSAITPAVFSAEADAVIARLRSGPARLDLEHVHFNRQSDYVFNRGRRIVRRIFALERLADAAGHIERLTGVRIEQEERLNRSAEPRFGALRPLIRLARAPYAALVPLPARQRLRAGLVRAGLYGDVETARFVPPGGTVDAFLRDHYQDDFALFAVARSEAGEGA